MRLRPIGHGFREVDEADFDQMCTEAERRRGSQDDLDDDLEAELAMRYEVSLRLTWASTFDRSRHVSMPMPRPLASRLSLLDLSKAARGHC